MADQLVELDALDGKILAILRERGDIPNNALADEVGLTPGPCLRRVQRLKRDGVIQRYMIMQNNAALGYSLGAFAEVTLTRHTADVARRFVRSMSTRKQVLGCHMVTGDCDFILRIVAKDLQEYRSLIWAIHSSDDVARVRSSLTLETFKDELNVRC